MSCVFVSVCLYEISADFGEFYPAGRNKFQVSLFINLFLLILQNTTIIPYKPLSPGQTDSFWTCVQLAFRLATHLHRLALTLVELKFGRK